MKKANKRKLLHEIKKIATTIILFKEELDSIAEILEDEPNED